jgi:hypothetical protein
VKDTVGFAEANRAQDDRLGLQRRWQPSLPGS